MVLGISVSTLGSIACASSPTIEFLIGARMLQGIGLSGGMVVGRATIRDLYGEDGAAQIIAGLSIVFTLVTSLCSDPGRLFAGMDRLAGQFRCRRGLDGCALALVLRYVPESPREVACAPPNRGLSPEPCWPAIAA